MYKRKKIVVVPGKILLDLPRNVKNLPYFALDGILREDFFSPQREKFRVTLNIIPSLDPKFKATGGIRYSSHYQVGKDSIYYERHYSLFTVKLLIEHLTKNQFNVFVNSQYLKLVRFKIDRLYPLGAHIMDLLLIKIIESGDLVLHGASLFNSKNKSAFLMIAPPDTGKSYTTYCFLNNPEDNFKFLGEDFSYYDGKKKELFCVPLTYTWGQYFDSHLLDPGKIPFVGLFLKRKKRTVKDIFGQQAVQERGKLRRIYLLEKSPWVSIKRTPLTKRVFQKVLTIQRYEFAYHQNPLLRAFDYVHGLGIEKIYEKEERLLMDLLRSTEVFEVMADEYRRFYEMIREAELG